MDIFATTANAVGAKAPTDRIVDGVDLLPFIEKKAGGRPHETLFWRTDSYRVVRHFDWKLQVAEIPKRDWLYDLGADPTEQKNLALTDPQRVKTLTSKIVDFNKTQVKPLWPSLAEAPIPIDKMMKQPQRPDDEFIYYAN
jgi:arylsulfatase A-like enzyme